MSNQQALGELEEARAARSAEPSAAQQSLVASAVTSGPRSDDPQLARYVRSYLLMRVFIGSVGIAVPLVLVLGNMGLGGDLQGSLSAYYYTGMREVFVALLAAIAVFLFTYRAAEWHVDNVLSFLAGIGVLFVVIFPTARPDGVDDDLTPLQNSFLTEDGVKYIHYAGAAAFIGSLALISWLFGKREGARARPGWKLIHYLCAGLIAGAVAFILAMLAAEKGWLPLGPFHRWLLVGEWWAVWAFAISWLMKGAELDALRSGGGISRTLHVSYTLITFGIWPVIWFVYTKRNPSA